MKKQVKFTSVLELHELKRAVLLQMDRCTVEMRAVMQSKQAQEILRKIKFQKLIEDHIFDERLNFVEYLNQSFTYLTCIVAAELILTMYPEKNVTINFGTQSGYDVFTEDGDVICECFTVASVKSNEKLKKDVARVHENQQAIKKLVVFYSEDMDAEMDYINKVKRKYVNVEIYGLTFQKLIAADLVGS